MNSFIKGNKQHTSSIPASGLLISHMYFNGSLKSAVQSEILEKSKT